MKTEEELQIIYNNVAESLPRECSRCLSLCSLSGDGKYLLRCNKKNCRKKISAFRNTFLATVQIKEKWKILRILDLWINNLNLENIKFVTGFNNDVIENTINLIKNICVPKYCEIIGTLGGDGVICEIDESKFGKRKYNQGRSIEGVWVLGIVEPSIQRRIFLVPVSDRSRIILSEIINTSVLPNSTIYIDKWR